LPSHRQFAETHALPFYLLSDADGSLRASYGVSNRLWVIPQRATFVIDKQGIIRLVFFALLKGPVHVQQALDALARLKGEA
jgi:peroxiredoxin Q/BCP